MWFALNWAVSLGSLLFRLSGRGQTQVRSGKILLTCDSRAHRIAGMSLVDQNMVPFQTAYPLVIFLVICVLAGNTCLVSPIPIRMLGAADILSLRGQPILYVFSSSFS